MFSYVLSSATSYFHLPIDDDEEEGDGLPFYPRHIAWEPVIDSTYNHHSRFSSFYSASSSSSSSSTSSATSKPHNSRSQRKAATMNEVLAHDDLYEILGVSKSTTLDKMALRRAYLSRSKACHPDKFPDNPEATHAFQKVSVAYDVLSTPSSKRMYDSRKTTSPYDFFASRPTHAEETFRGVILGVFNDFLDGDLEMIQTLLRAMNDINPSLKLGEDGMKSLLATLHSVRERALTCRTAVFAMHTELTRIVEIQHSFRQLSYFDVMGRTRLTIQLTRVTISLPVTLEKAIQEQNTIYGHQRNITDDVKPPVLPRHVNTLIRGVDSVLERMERMLK